MSEKGMYTGIIVRKSESVFYGGGDVPKASFYYGRETYHEAGRK